MAIGCVRCIGSAESFPVPSDIPCIAFFYPDKHFWLFPRNCEGGFFTYGKGFQVRA